MPNSDNCRFNISVNWALVENNKVGTWVKGKLQGNIEEYLKLIKKALNIENLKQHKVYNKMGSFDIIVEMENIRLYDLLYCYKKKALLTHTCNEYDKRWLNIETELLPQKEVI